MTRFDAHAHCGLQKCVGLSEPALGAGEVASAFAAGARRFHLKRSAAQRRQRAAEAMLQTQSAGPCTEVASQHDLLTIRSQCSAIDRVRSRDPNPADPHPTKELHVPKKPVRAGLLSSYKLAASRHAWSIARFASSSFARSAQRSPVNPARRLAETGAELAGLPLQQRHFPQRRRDA